MKANFAEIKRVFKLYKREESKLESTFFDLISGDTETKQTKGFAYLLKSHPEILSELLKIKEISSGLKQMTKVDVRGLNASDMITIDAEMLSEGNHSIRRDITITFYSNNKKIFVLIIEAKSIKKRNVSDIECQLNKYFHPDYFPSDYNVPKLGISLTKNHYLFDTACQNFVSITWIQIIELLSKVKGRQKKIIS